MRVRDVMTRQVITVRSRASVRYAASLLARYGFTALPVVDDGELVGVISEGDIIGGRFPRDPRDRPIDGRHQDGRDQDGRQPPGDGPRPAPARTVAEVMCRSVLTVPAGADVVDLVRTMVDGHVRSIPVLEGPRVVGIVTRRDLLRVLARDDAEIADDVRRLLMRYDGSRRWSVRVQDGVVDIRDQFDDPMDQHIAAVLSETVRGVTSAHAGGRRRESGKDRNVHD